MPVVLSEDLRENPEGTLRALCKAIEIEFKPEMLRVGSGPETRRRMLGALVVQNHPREHAIRAAPPG